MKLVSDMFDFAYDRKMECTIILMSSDGGFAIPLDILWRRGVRCIVIHGVDKSLSATLTSNADISLSLQDDILRRSTQGTTTLGRPPTIKKIKKTKTVEGSHRIQRAMLVCKALATTSNNDARWIPLRPVFHEFKHLSSCGYSKKARQLFQYARKDCETLKWVERGFLVIGEKGETTIATEAFIRENPQWVRETPQWEYYRLTKRGRTVSCFSSDLNDTVL